MRLIPGWKRKIWRHAGIALFWSAVGGLLIVWPALADHIPTAVYVVGGILISGVYGVAKVLHRPGAE